MIDDIFAFRDGFASEVAKVFEGEGWVVNLDKKETFWSFNRSFTDTELSSSFSLGDIVELTRIPKVRTGASVSKAELNRIRDQISPPIKGFYVRPVILNSMVIEENIPNTGGQYGPFIKELSYKMTKWGELQNETKDYEVGIKKLAKPWETHLQVGHLAALAFVGDFNTLMDYVEMFKRGKRANFYPYIKPEMLDRALDIALERA